MFEVVEIPVRERAVGAGVKTNPIYLEIVKAVLENTGKAITVPNEALPPSFATKGKASIIKNLRSWMAKAGLPGADVTKFHSRRMVGKICVWSTVEDPFSKT
jgi:hypothetical protein